MNKPLQSCGWDTPRPLFRSSGPSSEVRPSPIVGRAIAPSPARATSPPQGTDPQLPPASLPLTGLWAAALGLAAQGTVVVPASSARETPDMIRTWDPGARAAEASAATSSGKVLGSGGKEAREGRDAGS